MSTKRTGTERFGQLLFYTVVLVIGYLAYLVAQPFLGPLAWAAILALSLNPLHERLSGRLGASNAALVTTLTGAVLIIGPLATIISMLAAELPVLVEFGKQLPSQATPERVQLLWDQVRLRVPIGLPEDPSQLLSQAAQTVVGFIAPRLGGAVANIASMLGSLFVTLFAMFFLLRDGDRVADMVRRVLPFPPVERERIITEAHDLVIASVGAGLAVAAVQGAVGGVAFWLLGLGAPVAWGVVMGICSLIPVVGAALIWVPVAGWLALSGALGKALVLTVIGTAVIGMVDNVLRPVLLSGRTSVNGLVVFIGLLGGTSAFGFVGLVLGPIVLVIAGTLVEALTRHASAPPPSASASPE